MSITKRDGRIVHLPPVFAGVRVDGVVSISSLKGVADTVITMVSFTEGCWEVS